MKRFLFVDVGRTRIILIAAIVAVALAIAATVLVSSAQAHCLPASGVCQPGQALAKMKSYISKECHKWDSVGANTRCFRTSNGKPGDPTRIYASYAHTFRGYGTYVFGYVGVPMKCSLVRIWEVISKHDGHLSRFATETKDHKC